MEIFTNKSLVLKIVIALVIVILFNFCVPTLSHAGIGGTLLGPIVDLLVAVGDGAMLIIQSLIVGFDYSVIRLTDDPPTMFDWLTWTGDVGLHLVNWGAKLFDGVMGIFGQETSVSSVTDEWVPHNFYLPIYVVSPEEIFQNKIGLLDVNFFNPNKYEASETIDGGQVDEQTSTARVLQPTIASWYLTLRNFAIIVLLIVLLYIGIRIVTSSAAQDRAKYKEKLFSWIVAMCLLFFMHYIMAFATTIVEEISKGISKSNKSISVGLKSLEGYYIETKNEDGLNVYINATNFFTEKGLLSDNGEYLWPTNLLGTVRIQMQLEPDGLSDDNIVLRKMGYTVLYIILIFYTAAFLVVYIKRTIMLAFLTMIAPLVAMTYPLDKMNDGNAQAFNMWLKEYVFNLLIQPFHLILYTMLVGSAIELAQSNVIYAIVAIGFIFQAEKILRKFFGFDKASTIDTNGSTVGGMLAMAGINQLKRIGNMGKKKDGKNGGNSGNGNTSPRLRTADRGKSAAERLNQSQQASRDRQGRRNGESSNSETDFERANRFRELRESGMSQEEALEQINNELPFNRENNPDNGETDFERANRFRELRESGMSQEEALEQINNELPFDRENNPDSSSLSEDIPEAIDNSTAPQRLRDRFARSKVSKPIKGIMGVAGAGLKYAIPKAGKLYAKAALGIAAGTIGVAAGFASDDDRNVLKYGGAGVVAGWAAGSAAGGIVSNAGHKVEEIGENIASTYTLSAGGPEAEKARLQAKEDRAAMKDKDRRKMYLDKVNNASQANIKQILKDAQEYRESGVTDDRLIIKAMNANGFGNGRANNERVILAQLANETGNDNKKIEDIKKRLSSRGLSNEDVNKYIDGIREITGAI